MFFSLFFLNFTHTFLLMSTEISNEQLIHKFAITLKIQYSLPIQPKIKLVLTQSKPTRNLSWSHLAIIFCPPFSFNSLTL